MSSPAASGEGNPADPAALDEAAPLRSRAEPTGRIGTWRHLWPFVRPHRWVLWFGVFALVLESGLSLCRPWPLKIVLDRVLPAHPQPIEWRYAPVWLVRLLSTDRVRLLVAAGAALIFLSLATGLLAYLYKTALGRLGRRLAYQLRRDLFSHLQQLPLSFHDGQRTGDLITRMTSDVATLQDLVSDSGVELIGNAILVLGMATIMLLMNWRFALLSLSTAPLVYGVLVHHRRRVKRAAQQARRENGLLASVAQETLTSIRIVQGLAQERQQEDRFEAHNLASLEAYLQGILYQASVAPIVDLLEAVALALLLTYGALHVLSGELTAGDVVIFFAYTNRLYNPVKALAKLSLAWTKSTVAAERVAGVLALERRIADDPGALPAPRFRGAIEFRKVSFRYEREAPVLLGVDFSIQPGEKVAVVGPTGGGKSTILGLLLRFNDPDGGTILIDGEDLRRYRVRSVRSQIGLVLQEPLLFSGSVRDNIAFGRPGAADEEIAAAARTACAHEFIERLPRGYDTPIAERGTTLSGGQRQRLAIARAVLRDAPILLFDEPTTGLDPESEEMVLRAIAKAAEGKTTFIISHRPAGIRLAERVLLLANGVLLPAGTPEQFLSRGRWGIGGLGPDPSAAEAMRPSGGPAAGAGPQV